MRPTPTVRAAPHRIHPALDSFADDCRGTLTGVLAYAGALALIGWIVATAAGPLTDAAITAATEIFASRIELAGNTAGGEILRQTSIIRKDIPGGTTPGPIGATGPGAEPLRLRGAL